MGHSSAFSFALLVSVLLPSLVFYTLFLHLCGELETQQGQEDVWRSVCQWGRLHPWYLLNVLFFLNVDILFWIIGILQKSVWLMDAYWSIIPILIVQYFAAHPLSQTDQLRSRSVIYLMWFWGIRLTYSYLRREDWRWGDREDWRIADLRKQLGKHWWWMSLFIVFLSQHIFLMGLTLPLYSVYHSQLPWNVWDGLASLLCISGVLIAHIADTQLYYFVYKNKILKDIGGPKVTLLDYSRHPNYFGEQLFRWG